MSSLTSDGNWQFKASDAYLSSNSIGFSGPRGGGGGGGGGCVGGE